MAGHSRIGFKVRKMGLYFVKGTFKGIRGSVDIGPDQVPTGGSLTIDASTVSTRMPPRDWHLRTRDFLAVKQHPEIRVSVDRVDRESGETVTVAAMVAIRDVEMDVPLTVHWHPAQPGGSLAIVMHLWGTLDRRQFGLRPRRPIDWIVAHDVHLDALVHLEPAQ